MVNRILDIAKGEIGYTEKKTNLTKYGEAYGWNGVAWCVIYIWWLFAQLGSPDLFYGGGKTASCSQLYAYHKKQGQAVSWSRLKPGDIIFMCFDGSGDTDHVGIVEKVNGSSVTTIEGNTSDSSKGSQANGGGVYRRTRYKANFAGAYRPKYEVKPEIIPYNAEAFTADLSKLLEVEGDALKAKLPVVSEKQNRTHEVVKFLQVRLFALGYLFPKYGADGDFGTECGNAVEDFQRDRDLTADRIVGKNTWSKLTED